MNNKAKAILLALGHLTVANCMTPVNASDITDHNDFSDHNVLSHNKTPTKVVQLNVAQLGRLKLFPNSSTEEGFNWSSTLRTVPILKLLGEKKDELSELGKRLFRIAQDESISSVSEKNEKMATEAENLKSELQLLGFTVKDFILSPHKIFNPTANSKDLWQKPGEFIHGPSYMLENIESYQKRMANAYYAMFKDTPDIVTAQEIELGELDGINFTDLFSSIMENYPVYSYEKPVLQAKGSVTTTMTFYNKKIFENVSNTHEYKINILRDAFKKMFADSDLSLQIHALKILEATEPFFVVNLHANYTLANKREAYKQLNEILLTNPGIIVAGDFNLQLKNRAYLNDAIEGFSGVCEFKETPEPQDVGNPTYDAIFIG